MHESQKQLFLLNDGKIISHITMSPLLRSQVSEERRRLAAGSGGHSTRRTEQSAAAWGVQGESRHVKHFCQLSLTWMRLVDVFICTDLLFSFLCENSAFWSFTSTHSQDPTEILILPLFYDSNNSYSVAKCGQNLTDLYSRSSFLASRQKRSNWSRRWSDNCVFSRGSAQVEGA